jgi:hypothetical protein
MVTTVAPTTPVEAARRAPTKITEIPKPPRTFPKEKKEKTKADSAEKERNLDHLRRIKGEVEAELLHTCMEIIGYLENTLVKGA